MLAFYWLDFRTTLKKSRVICHVCLKLKEKKTARSSRKPPIYFSQNEQKHDHTPVLDHTSNFGLRLDR